MLDRRHLLTLLALAPLVTRAGPAGAQDKEPAGPQPELPKEKLVITTRDGAQHVFDVEMALRPEQQITGLMFRPTVPQDGGMLSRDASPRTPSPPTPSLLGSPADYYGWNAGSPAAASTTL